MSSKFWPTSAAIAAFTAVLLTWQIHARTGDETFVCAETGDCPLGSGLAWLLTGAAIVGAGIALLGAAWTRRLHNNGKLSPFAYRLLPDGEQIFEILAVLLAGLFTYWFVRNGPSIEPARPLDIGAPNTWALNVRNVRLPDGVREVTSVPSRLSWFIIGSVLGAPFAMSFGTMISREFYGRRRRQGEESAAKDRDDGRAESDVTEEDSSVEAEASGVIDLTGRSTSETPESLDTKLNQPKPPKKSSSVESSRLDEIDFD